MGFSLSGFLGTEVLGDAQLVIQTVLYFGIVLFGMMTAIPVGVTSNKFDGGCLLYAKVNVIRRDSQWTSFTINYGSKSSCDYVIAIYVLFGILYALTMAVLHLVVIIKRLRQSDIEIVRTFMFNTVILGINCFIAFLCFIASCVIAVGFKKWCNELSNNYPGQDKCSDYEDFIQWKKYDGSSFHKSFSLASSCAWLSTIAWVLQASLNGLTMYKQTHRKSRPKSPASTAASTAASTPTSMVSSLARF